MRWLQTEYILKGIFLGLLLFVALVESDWTAFGLANLLAFGGLALFLAVAAWRKLRDEFRFRGGNLLAFVLFLILESPQLIFTGIMLGMAAAALYTGSSGGDTTLLVGLMSGGAILG